LNPVGITKRTMLRKEHFLFEKREKAFMLSMSFENKK